MHTHLIALQESKTRQDYYTYNQLRENSITTITDKAVDTRFIMVTAPNVAGVMPAVGVATQAFCDAEHIARHDPLKIMVANLSYVGTGASGLTLELAELISSGCASDPSATCALILFSNVSHLAILHFSFACWL
jgi:hypothetical protein